MDMKHGKTTARRFLSVLLALVMCLGMLPGTVLAADTKDTDVGETRAGNVDAEAGLHFPIGILRRAAAARGVTSGNVDVTDNRVTGVRVAYPSVKRDAAEITYADSNSRQNGGTHRQAAAHHKADWLHDLQGECPFQQDEQGNHER